MRFSSIIDAIGNTPHIKLAKLFGDRVSVWSKVESFNPGHSIKDRIGRAMIEDAEQRGILTKTSVIVEPTSGNTGIGLAMVAAVKGYRCILVMPESMTVERRRYMAALGAELVLTPREKGMKGAIERAEQIVQETPGAWMPMQFENPANIAIHERTTALEIIKDFPEGLDYLITGVGTGGHLSGCARILKERFPQLKVFAVEPAKSTVISGGTHTPHKIQGIGAGFIPKNLNTALLDGTIQVTEEAAFSFAVRAAKEEGIFMGISSGASLAAVSQKLSEIADGKSVLTFTYDTGERYLSIEGLFG
jgi:cysteine synthase A